MIPVIHLTYSLLERTTSNIFTDVTFTCPALSDHSAILSVFSIPSRSRSPRITKLIRNIKKIDTTTFSNDIFSSSLYTAPLSSLNAYILQSSFTLSLLLDKHAPLKIIPYPSQQRKPFFTNDILKEKTKRSKLETIYRRNKTPANKANFKNQARFLNKLITASRRSYFRNLISSCTSQPKKLWSALNSLLSRKPPPCLPTFTDPSQLASSFLNFFGDKITRLCATLNQASVTTGSAFSLISSYLLNRTQSVTIQSQT